MNTLRAKIAVLLVVAIIGVVAMATILTVFFVRGQPPENGLDALVGEIQMIHELASKIPLETMPPILKFMSKPLKGIAIPDFTSELNQRLVQNGSELRLEVIHQNGLGATASMSVPGRGWIGVPLPMLPTPPAIWPVLVGWITLTSIGVTCISLYVAGKIIRPLAMLNAAVGAISPDGILPKLPETGPAEIKATAAAINKLSSHLQLATESRMRLVAGAGHDLRTPMTRLRIRAEFLPQEDREAWLNDLDELDRIADSAITLVREEIAPGETGPLRFDILIEQIANELKELEMPVHICEIKPAIVKAAPLALKRALRNLIVNAATHGQGAVIRLSNTIDSSVLRIDDSGPGIPADLLDQVFEPFFRVDPARRQSIPGAGLGLAIAKEIIQRYGGSLIIENRREGGLRQIISFNRPEESEHEW
jgi:signal transduction histidine kinase